MRYVIDASVGFKWEVVEPLSEKAQRLRDDFRKGVCDLLLLELFPIEVANALLVAERRGIIFPGQGVVFLADVFTTLPHLYPSLPDILPRDTRDRSIDACDGL